ncbi:2375_t:CDS:2, partial [Ambispora leptoticha]
KIKLFDTISSIREWRREQALKGYSVGFVATMGALHAGHLSLVNQAKEKCDQVVVSIFVNPAQFAPHEDLSKYPRTLDTDLESLTETKSCDVVFLPSVNDIYPSGIPLEVEKQQGTFVEVLGKSHQMEGKTRPIFFRGVATVCSKLFNIIQPDHVFFGQKDAQQCVVIRNLIRDLHFPIVMKVGETLRESDGLAMSSRNKYLTAEMRPFANVLYRALTEAKNQFDNGKRDRNEILTPAYQLIQDVIGNAMKLGFEIKLDYLSLVDPSTLEELDVVVTDCGAIISGAVWS